MVHIVAHKQVSKVLVQASWTLVQFSKFCLKWESDMELKSLEFIATGSLGGGENLWIVKPRFLGFQTGSQTSDINPHLLAYKVFPDSSVGKEFACNSGDLGSMPGLGRSPGEAKGYPLQYSGLENSMDCIVHGVTKSRTRLSDFHFHWHIKLPSVGTSEVIQ